MKLNNSLIFGDLPTTANGEINRVKEGEFLSASNTDNLYGDKIFLRSLLLPDEILDDCIDYCMVNKPRLIVCAGDDLYESGKIEAKYHLSPIMLLHKMGLLNENCSVVGGICIDRDDVDLMAQCGAKLIVCPSYSLGNGKGMPLVSSALGKIDVGIGTYDNSFNSCGDIIEEARLLLLGTNGVMRKKGAMDYELLATICGAEDADSFVSALGVLGNDEKHIRI